MKKYTIERQILVRAPQAEVWSFFSKPQNLLQITPEYMNFRIISCPEAAEIYSGMLIEYRVSPVLRMPLKWVTEIKDVDPGSCFKDTQRNGPYALWEHTHTFEATREGTLMTDRIEYALPMGPLGTFAHSLFVRRQLESLFTYRESRIRTLFETRP